MKCLFDALQLPKNGEQIRELVSHECVYAAHTALGCASKTYFLGFPMAQRAGLLPIRSFTRRKPKSGFPFDSTSQVQWRISVTF